jgi:hypothetical protein
MEKNIHFSSHNLPVSFRERHMFDALKISCSSQCFSLACLEPQVLGRCVVEHFVRNQQSKI